MPVVHDWAAEKRYTKSTRTGNKYEDSPFVKARLTGADFEDSENHLHRKADLTHVHPKDTTRVLGVEHRHNAFTALPLGALLFPEPPEQSSINVIGTTFIAGIAIKLLPFTSLARVGASGTLIGATRGFVEGLIAPVPQPVFSVRLKLNGILNAVGRQAGKAGNALACICTRRLVLFDLSI